MYGAATNHECLAIVLGLFGVAINIYQGHEPRRDFELLVKGILLGIVVDTLLIQLNLISFTTNYWKAISPVWIWVIWAGFLSTVNHSLSWLKDRLVLAAIFGSVMGPLSYWAGVSLGAGHFDYPNKSLLVISIVWLFATPIIMRVSQGRSYPI
ncbi:DUF2878 domain-containing protein [Polynucleobacter sp. MWH-Spelu-300-X4]|uniref:DUF2878 domain-containing protein n=1 Tax=Polynucleobacter sp. MWH-Spelu-300-X4 TaxID=2689109 RepID=UPI001BFD9BBE|nr:DUF2878 domain-containing protein [Polynucleobacter sp. MWH-Spelu-300-X4]QWD80619.1 DUF2878 domain-containing protein [Polynucleobacter sp. MWH-Spelu-300-X4]